MRRLDELMPLTTKKPGNGAAPQLRGDIRTQRKIRNERLGSGDALSGKENHDMQAHTSSSTTATPPRDRAIAIAEVLHRVGCGRSRLYLMIRTGEFPGPTKFGRQSRWSERQLDAWLAERFKPH